ncbi:MAG: ATPase/protein kinase [Thermonema sp.]|uniref:methylmalonyl Co-A mutase-associated GTPase MeaB n=1 Tax=Thermonema sp. TaxID=2231181 RepID=UPI0021DEACB8|nr:methylmalonyl Co-A mutase-associated GTPase MeaB [Thermonema sp.]GIV39051.1 MAG: ATPase/protein kinase [Thermonema sp.]
MKRRLSIEEYTEGVLSGNRIILSKAITLVESRRPADRLLAMQLLERLLPHTGKSYRIGITGVPGVGKSTFIEAFGLYLIEQGHRPAVLAIDPSSPKTKGSILGDKTRMERLSMQAEAFIRPSASGRSLGGVAHATREAMLLCEAAGFDVVIIETVGVGQSEVLVKSMVDFFLLLMLAGAGDELQGIKKGIMEMADALVINKADGDNQRAAEQAKRAYENALHLFRAPENGWFPPVLTCSALYNQGMAEIWHTLLRFREQTRQNGYWEKNRQNQRLEWLRFALQEHLLEAFYRHEAVKNKLSALEEAVLHNRLLPQHAAHMLVDLFLKQQTEA